MSSSQRSSEPGGGCASAWAYLGVLGCRADGQGGRMEDGAQ